MSPLSDVLHVIVTRTIWIKKKLRITRRSSSVVEKTTGISYYMI
jgi:hypothetical protein